MLTRWDPMREMMGMRRSMERMFGNNFMDDNWADAITWNMPLDVAEDENGYTVKASIPGIKPEDVEITYNNNVLTIKGETKEEKDDEQSRYHLRERRYGSFARSITLPVNVNADAIQANCEAGVLTLHLPKAEEAKPKRILIQNGSSKTIEGNVKDVQVNQK